MTARRDGSGCHVADTTLSRARDEKSFDSASVEYSEKLEGQTTLLPVVSIVSKRATDKIWYGYSSQVLHEGLGSKVLGTKVLG